MKKHLISVVRLGCGAILLLVGIIGLLLPVIPGIPLILFGGWLLFGAENMQKMRARMVQWVRKIYR